VKSEILVIGDSCIDRFIYGKSERLCPDIPVPVFVPEKTEENMGMAGNVYNNLVSLGHGRYHCRLVTPTETITKERYVDKQTNYTFLRVDSNDKVESVSFIGSYLNRKKLSNYEAIVIADYGKGFLDEDAIKHICDLNENVFLDTKKTLGEFCRKAKFIKINEPEFEAMRDSSAARAALVTAWVDKLIVTLGAKGCMYGEKLYPTEKVEVYDLSGAGDTFQAALVSRYLETKNIEKAIEYANDCATKVVQRRGVALI
jgi:D-beta-D-heptose 7-phosphate kinase/D-beta-D-heptose 1-phosphate adenosyltransferase